MLPKLYNVLAVFSIASVLALGSFTGYLFAAGRLSGSRLDQVAAVLRGELDGVAPTSAPAEPHGATAGADEATSPSGHGPDEQAGASGGAAEGDLRRHWLERTRHDLAAQQQLLEQTLQLAQNQQQEVRQDLALIQKEKTAAPADDAGANRELELIAGLPPKQAKEHILNVWRNSQADAVTLLMALDVSKAKRILAQMKTPDEQNIMSQLLDQLRVRQADASVSGKTAGDGAP